MNIEKVLDALLIVVIAVATSVGIGLASYLMSSESKPTQEHKAKCESKGGVFIQSQDDEYCLKAEALMEFSE